MVFVTFCCWEFSNRFVSLNGAVSKSLGQKSHQMCLIDVSPETGCWQLFLIYCGIKKKRSAEGNGTDHLPYIVGRKKMCAQIFIWVSIVFQMMTFFCPKSSHFSLPEHTPKTRLTWTIGHTCRKMLYFIVIMNSHH